MTNKKMESNMTEPTVLPTAQMLCARFRPAAAALMACLLVTASGCDDDEPEDTTGAATDGDTDDMPGAECDPVGANAEVGMLLNAPVEADVEIITKVPTHPGDAGPQNLP